MYLKNIHNILLYTKYIFLPIIKHISLRRTNIYYFRTPITIFLQHHALLAVIGVCDAWGVADNASPFETSEITFIANADKSGKTDMRVTDNTTTITGLTDSTYGDSRLFATHY